MSLYARFILSPNAADKKKKKEQTYQNGLQVPGSLCSCDAQCAQKMEIDHNL